MYIAIITMTDFDTEEAKENRKETAAQRRKRLEAAVSEVLRTSAGRLVLSEILALCNVEGINGQDGVASGRIEGARYVGLKTIEMLRKADFGGWMNLYRELHDER